jgi:hypothetical protein
VGADPPISIRVLLHEFVDVEYDVHADVLYTRVENAPADGEGWLTLEGVHTLTLDESGGVVVIDPIGARTIPDREGAVSLTLPDGTQANVEGLGEALAFSR